MRLSSLIAVTALLFGACSDEPTGPNLSGIDPISIARIEIRPALDTIVVQETITPGDTVRLTAAVVMKSGAIRTDVPLAWESSDPAVASVDQTGLVRATGYGTATIKASAGRAATAEIIVVPAVAADSLPNRVAAQVAGALAVGGETTCVLTDRMRVWCTGANPNGELGSAGRDTVCADAYQEQAMIACSLVPLRVESDERFTHVTLGMDHGCALNVAGSALCWGRGDLGQLGNGSAGSTTAPTLVSSVHAFRTLAAGGEHTCGIAAEGSAWCWGSDSSGQLGGARLAAHSTTPIPVDLGRTDWVQLTAGRAHTCGIVEGGAAYCWGEGGAGQLGNGSSSRSLTPVAVSGGLSFVSVAAGDNMTCGLTDGGSVYCWGAGGDGQLGRGSSEASAVPVPVSGGGTFTALSAGGRLACGIRNGSAVCWGVYNLGDQGVQSAQSVPTVVAAEPSFVRIAAGPRHACGVTEAGEVHCWGSNVFGAFGDGLQALFRPTPRRFALPEV